MKNIALVVLVLALAVAGVYFYSTAQESSDPSTVSPSTSPAPIVEIVEDIMGGPTTVAPHPLSITALRAGEYPGSDLVIEQELNNGSNYKRYVVSYRSEGLKIYALLTVPTGTPPEGGWPAIVFNHGYIPPAEYRTTERYVAYTDAFSRAGYVLLRPDYRGHGNSEGEATGGYSSNDYTIDVLNALASLKRYENVNGEKIGMWGHSMGGHITLRSMVTDQSIKAGVIWAGVVAPYSDLYDKWRRPGSPSPRPDETPSQSTPNTRGGGWRQELSSRFGTPAQNADFWLGLSANSYLNEISGPLQIHHGTADTSVPVEFSETLDRQMKEAGQSSELYIYQGDDHNLSRNLGTALRRSVEYFDRFLK